MSEGIKIRGKKDSPGYGFEGEGLQPTLDGFRAYDIFQNLTPELDEAISGDIESALMYGSNVNGLSAFSDCEVYDWDSDMDLLYAIDADDMELARKEIKNYLESRDLQLEVNIDVQDVDEISSTLDGISEASSAEEIIDQEFKISYPDFYFGKSGPQRMRAFLTGFIPHDEFSGEVVRKIDDAMDNIVGHIGDPQLLEELTEGARDYSDRLKEMSEFERPRYSRE